MKACKDCVFAHREKPEVSPLNLFPQEILFCRFGPPSPVPIPQKNGSISITPIHPAVAPTHWCHRFELPPPIVSADSPPLVTADWP